MPRRAGKRRTEKRALMAKIKEAQKKDEEARRAAPRIIEEQILLDLPPLLRVKPRKGLEKRNSSSEDSLHLFPEEFDRDLTWSPDEFDREYFRLWEEEREEEWEDKRRKKLNKIEKLFGEDSETEGEKREIEKDRKERIERERKEEELRLFGVISDSEEEIEKGEERMDWEEERREDEEMSWEEEDDVVMIEEETRIDKLEKEIEREIEKRAEKEKKGGAGASRAIVPKRVKGYWLKARSRLDLCVPLPIRKKF